MTRINDCLSSPRKMIVNVEFEDRFIAQMDFMPMHNNEDHPWLKHNTSSNFGFEITGKEKKFAYIDGKYHDDLLIFKEI